MTKKWNLIRFFFYIVTFNIQKLYMTIILENKSLNKIIRAAKSLFPPKITGQTKCGIVFL